MAIASRSSGGGAYFDRWAGQRFAGCLARGDAPAPHLLDLIAAELFNPDATK